MLSLVAAVAVAPVFAAPEPWALGFAAPPRIPLVGDVDADGYADLICVYPPGGSIIDVSLNVGGQKAGRPFQGLNPWGQDCQAAVAAEIDLHAGADVLGLFGGNTLLLAGAFKANRFTSAEWLKLPQKLDEPALGLLNNGKAVAVFSRKNGRGYQIEFATKKVTALNVPRNTLWLGSDGSRDLRMASNGRVFTLDGKAVAVLDSASRPAASGGMFASPAFVQQQGLERKLDPVLAPSHFGIGDVDKDGDLDLFEFRYGSEKHVAHQILVRRQISADEADSDSDGLTNSEETQLRTDPHRSDTDGDGLLDGWEVRGFRGLDLPKLGCSPLRADLICYIARFENVPEDHVQRDIKRVIEFYQRIDDTNPDGSKGWSFHPIFQEPVKGDDMNKPWWANRDKFLPSQHRGMAHWMQITQGGGGQADQLGDGGGCGMNALWAVFVHEFGHQLGMDHDGFWENGLNPIYRSLMSYAYSYSLEDDGNKITYSKGEFKDFIINETNLSEVLPLPYEKVKFLEKGPYRFRLKPNGATTLIDWNWNGVFGEQNIRADINYSYSTHGGRRDEVGKAHTSPWLFVHNRSAFALYGRVPKLADPKKPNIGPDQPGELLLRKLKKPFEWEEPVVIDTKLIGDPVAASYRGEAHLVYPIPEGIAWKRVGGKFELIDTRADLVPTIGEAGGKLYLFLWDPKDGSVRYHMLNGGKWSAPKTLAEKSTIPVGVTFDSIKKHVVVGMAQNQDANRPHRWQIRRFLERKGELVPVDMEWIEGEAGGARGPSRCIVLFERGKDAGPDGRIHFFGQGMTSPQAPWSCTYVASQIADKSIRGGWLVKRYYDEWTQTRSAPAAAWFDGDIIWAYRWVDGGFGPTDNNLHVAYKASGIQDARMGDHDDIAHIRGFGMRHSILYLNR